MIYVINKKNRQIFTTILDDMHHMRYRVSVEQWGWPLKCARPGYDEDEFDSDDTIYFVKTNETGKVIAAARLNPTVKPHMMTEIFPEYCTEQPPIQDPNTYEMSRLTVDISMLKKRAYVYATYEILAAICEFCINSKIERITWLGYHTTYNASLDVWDTRPLGIPTSDPVDKSVYVAAVSPMTREALDKTKAKARIDGDITLYIDPNFSRYSEYLSPALTSTG